MREHLKLLPLTLNIVYLQRQDLVENRESCFLFTDVRVFEIISGSSLSDKKWRLPSQDCQLILLALKDQEPFVRAPQLEQSRTITISTANAIFLPAFSWYKLNKLIFLNAMCW